MINMVKCKNCGTEIEISEALKHQIEEAVLKDLTAKHNEEIEKTKKDAEEKALLKISKEIELKLKDKENETAELKNQNKALMDQVLEMGKSVRELKTSDQKRELEFQKKLETAAEKIREEEAKKEEEKSNFKIAELEKKLTDTQKSLAEAQKKSTQGSQQLQGEVLEQDLERRLKDAFLHDEVEEVAKGTEGGDILQKVKNSYGQVAGIILWETKRAKWRPSWIPKLKEDARKVNASVIILVSEELPREVNNFDMVDGVLITSNSFALPLAQILRMHLMQVARAKFTAANKDEKLESLYSYLQSETFRHRFESYVEGIVEMQQDFETEKRSTMRLWKKREVQINKTLGNLTNMYGELQGIMGSALPDIKLLSLPHIDSHENEDKS